MRQRYDEKLKLDAGFYDVETFDKCGTHYKLRPSINLLLVVGSSQPFAMASIILTVVKADRIGSGDKHSTNLRYQSRHALRGLLIINDE